MGLTVAVPDPLFFITYILPFIPTAVGKFTLILFEVTSIV